MGLGFFFLFLFLEGGHKGGRVNLVGMGNGCDWSAFREIPKYEIKILCWKKKSKDCVGHDDGHL